jgi:hypothetical protein
MTYAEVYVSGDAFSNSLVVSPALALRRMHATRLTPEMTRLGVGAFVGYKYFYGEPQNDAISVALMLGGVNYWPIDHLNVYQSSSTINVYARLAIGYVLSTRNR